VRYIAIDLGDKRTGLAVGDSVTRLVTPLDVLESPVTVREGEQLLDDLERAIGAQVGPHTPAELVVGLPINMCGTEGQRAKLVRTLAARIAQRTGRRVHFQDERLTSAEADWSMARSGMTHKDKKQRRDALAAAAILRDFLAALERAAGEDENDGDEPREVPPA
jgi:putative Holliday junction resolvase